MFISCLFRLNLLISFSIVYWIFEESFSHSFTQPTLFSHQSAFFPHLINTSLLNQYFFPQLIPFSTIIYFFSFQINIIFQIILFSSNIGFLFISDLKKIISWAIIYFFQIQNSLYVFTKFLSICSANLS